MFILKTPMTPMVVLAPPTLSAETTLTGADELSLEYSKCSLVLVVKLCIDSCKLT